MEAESSRVASPDVKPVASRRFWELFHSLPPDVQKLAVKNYELWRQDPITRPYASEG
jgi:hypothetical protein